MKKTIITVGLALAVAQAGAIYLPKVMDGFLTNVTPIPKHELEDEYAKRDLVEMYLWCQKAARANYGVATKHAAEISRLREEVEFWKKQAHACLNNAKQFVKLLQGQAERLERQQRTEALKAEAERLERKCAERFKKQEQK